MVEQGLVQYIQAGIGSPPIAPGGWATQLPKDLIGEKANQVRMAWVWRSITAPPTDVLEGQDGVTPWSLAIDCHGYTAADSISLARRIDGVLRGARSVTLPDADSTFVQAIHRDPPAIDGINDLNRSFVRTLQYTVTYNQT